MPAIELGAGRGLVAIGHGDVVAVLRVLVVAERAGMAGRCLACMPAIRTHGRPAELERQQGQQDDEEKATHGVQSKAAV